jgi:hypothetical protein
VKQKYLVYILKYHNAHCVRVLCVPDIDKCLCHVCRWLEGYFTLPSITMLLRNLPLYRYRYRTPCLQDRTDIRAPCPVSRWDFYSIMHQTNAIPSQAPC